MGQLDALGKILGSLLILTGGMGCQPSISAPEQPPAATVTPQLNPELTPAPRPATPWNSAALSPQVYCYGINSDTLTGAIRLGVNENQQITGDSQISIHNREVGYFSSYAQKFAGVLKAQQAVLNLTTWIEYDVQSSQETWTVTPTSLDTGRTYFTRLDCTRARERFVGPDGLEAADLLHDPGANYRRQQVQFQPGTSAAVLTDALVRGDRQIYQLEAQGGQQMILNISAVEENAVFDLISPSGRVLMREGRQETILLPETGEYQVIVGGTRGNATYTLQVSIN